MLTPFFRTQTPTDAETAAPDTTAYAGFVHAARAAGVILAPSQFEAMFCSFAHDNAVINATAAALASASAPPRP